MKTTPRRGGFTLIELMAAMVILAIIVLMVGMIFTDADRIWYLGTGRTMNCISGRAAMNLITHDLEHAAADNVLTFVSRPDTGGTTFYGCPTANDEVCMVSLQHDSDDLTRTAREIFYYVKTNSTAAIPATPGNLMRGYYSAEISAAASVSNHCYQRRNWYDPPSLGGAGRPGNSRPIVEHVTALSFLAPTNQNGCVGVSFYSTNSYAYAPNYVLRDGLPEYVDVYLEVLDELDADKLSGLDATNRAAFVERNARRYTTRVYFQNRLGYKRR